MRNHTSIDKVMDLFLGLATVAVVVVELSTCYYFISCYSCYCLYFTQRLALYYSYSVDVVVDSSCYSYSVGVVNAVDAVVVGVSVVDGAVDDLDDDVAVTDIDYTSVDIIYWYSFVIVITVIAPVTVVAVAVALNVEVVYDFGSVDYFEFDPMLVVEVQVGLVEAQTNLSYYLELID